MVVHAHRSSERRGLGDPGRNSRQGQAHEGGRGDSGQPALVAFYAHPMDGGDAEGGVPIRPEAILFAFTAGAVNASGSSRRRGAIVAKWAAKHRSSPGVVYLRTRRGVYRSHVRTLREFRQMVSSNFDAAGQSVVVNLPEADYVNLGREKPRTLAYAIEESDPAWPLEIVVVKRSCLKRIRERFGWIEPATRSRSAWAGSGGSPRTSRAARNHPPV